MVNTTERDDRTAPNRRIGLPRLGRALAGAVAVIGLLGIATPTTVAAETQDAAGGGRPIRSHLELAQAALEADQGNLAVIVTAVDYVDGVEGSGTNTAVDVFFPSGECVATGPIDFQPRGLRSARLAGELTADCFDREQDLTFTASVAVDLTWVGFGPRQRIPIQFDPDDPCRSRRFERRATTSGTVTIDGGDGGIQVTATPTGDAFDLLARQRDLCRTAPLEGNAPAS